MKPNVAIVIVNWNKREYVAKLLNALRDINYARHDTILVDNASTDGTSDLVTRDYPTVHVIQNEDNLGGTGGFNTGMRYAIQQNKYKYIWLLDNDAFISNDSLAELVTVMENDDQIGVAGSIIYDSDDRNVIVECGSNFRWDTIGVVPVFRNYSVIPSSQPIEVDYVAVCSALVRASILPKVGIMDERYFLFWDDMDWGLSFKENGHKVVAVPTSKVYHPSFTEKRRGEITVLYYGIRNSLLTYSKRAPTLKRLSIFYRYFRYFCKGLIFFLMNNQQLEHRLATKAVRDFLNGRWGRYVGTDIVELRNQQVIPHRVFNDITKMKRILLLGDSVRDDILRVKEKIESLNKNSCITLIVRNDRASLFKSVFPNIIILQSEKFDNFFYNLVIFLKIFFMRFDVVVSLSSSPLSYAVKRSCQYVAEDDSIRISQNGYYSVYKPVIATVVGELLSCIVTPVVFLKSMKHYRQKGARS